MFEELLNKKYFSGRKIAQSFNQLSTFWKLVISIVATGALVLFVALPVKAFNAHIEETERLAIVRKRHFDEISHNVKRYKSLRQKLDKLKASLDESKMTFSQVTRALDTVIKDTIGSQDYELKKSGSPKEMSNEYQMQDFSLEVKSVTLDQLIKLLYKVEQGKSPFFLGKVDITRTRKQDEFRVRLKVTTVGAQ